MNVDIFFTRSRITGIGIILYLVVQYTFAAESLVSEVSNVALGIASMTLILLSDRRCITSKRSLSRWLLEMRRARK